MDIRYSVLDFEVSPLPPQFYPMMENLWDLEELDAEPSIDTMVQIVQELGFPMPGGQSPRTFPVPAGPNPYEQMQPPQMEQRQAGVVIPGNTQPAYGAQSMPMQSSMYPSTGMQGNTPPQSFNPPPLSSTGAQRIPNVPNYSPQPSQAQGTNQVGGRPDGRDRCFGSFTPGDNQCNTCPADLQPTCMLQTRQQAPRLYKRTRVTGQLREDSRH